MAAPTVYENVDEDVNLGGQLFAGKKFFVVQRVPLRNHYVDLIRNNGGELVKLEKQADYLIADHFRRDCPPGSISYTFIEKSLEKAEIQDPQEHTAGPPLGTARDVGSLNRPAKGGRMAYTAEEDRILYKWVRDAEAAGASVSGNEIYKQLEAKHPRHTWQSWRDRYIKQLRDRPPSAFNIPDNAPPSPPSDEPVGSTQANQPVATESSASTSRRPDTLKKIKSEPEYTVADFESIFDTEDWEELYAFVDLISQSSGEAYFENWEEWAKSTTNTASQWRQYFEKVVRPQWKRDPPSRRAQIKKLVEERHEMESSQKSSQSSAAQELDQDERSTFEPRSASPSRDSSSIKRKHMELDQGHFEKVPDKGRTLGQAPQDSEREASGKATQVGGVKAKSVEIPPTKKQRLERVSPHLEDELEQVLVPGTQPQPQPQPIEISSASISSESQSSHELDTEDIINAVEPMRHITKVNVESLDSDLEMYDLEAIAPPQGLDPLESDDYPSNTPTPRATRHQTPTFDTQAILSSPSQGFSLQALPLPISFTEEVDANSLPEDSPDFRSSSPAQEPGSEASTTQSLEEFRLSLDKDAHSPIFEPLVNVERSSIPPSSPADSADPYPTLDDAEDTEAFFEEQLAEGFTVKQVAEALKHTRFRPDLAVEVLDAWKEGQPLPNMRGVWSKEDDEDLESGDGVALAWLEKKHTLDGWGGVTERSRYLAQYRSREEKHR